MAQGVHVLQEQGAAGHLISDQLAQSGFTVMPAADAPGAVKRLLARPAPLVIFSRSLRRAAELCAAVRWAAAMGVFAIVPWDDSDAVTTLIEAGADCVIPAGVDRRELAARLSAAWRAPASDHASPAPPRQVGALDLDERRHRVAVCGRQLSLTPTEFRLLAALARRGGSIAKHEELITEVWGKDAPDGTKDLRLYVGYLRKKLDGIDSPGLTLVNQRGVGYRLIEAVAS